MWQLAVLFASPCYGRAKATENGAGRCCSPRAHLARSVQCNTNSMKVDAPVEIPSGRRLQLLSSALPTRFWTLLACFLDVTEARARFRCIRRGGEEGTRSSIVIVIAVFAAKDGPGERRVCAQGCSA